MNKQLTLMAGLSHGIHTTAGTGSSRVCGWCKRSTDGELRQQRSSAQLRRESCGDRCGVRSKCRWTAETSTTIMMLRFEFDENAAGKVVKPTTFKCERMSISKTAACSDAIWDLIRQLLSWEWPLRLSIERRLNGNGSPSNKSASAELLRRCAWYLGWLVARRSRSAEQLPAPNAPVQCAMHQVATSPLPPSLLSLPSPATCVRCSCLTGRLQARLHRRTLHAHFGFLDLVGRIGQT